MQLSSPQALAIQDVGALRQRWLAELEAWPREAREGVVDLAAVPEVDAAGLQLLLSLARSLDARGARLRLVGVSNGLRETLAGLRCSLGAQVEG